MTIPICSYGAGEGNQEKNLPHPTKLKIGGSYKIEGITGVAIKNNYAYLASQKTGLHIVDISNPVKPEFVGAYDGGMGFMAVFVRDNYAYLAPSSDYALAVIDVSDAANPVLIGKVRTTGAFDGAWDVKVSGNHAYVTSDHSLQSIDVTDPSNPVFKSYYTDKDVFFPADFEISGDYAYVAETSHLYVIDISDPSNLTLAGKIPIAGYTGWDLVVRDNYVFMADDRGIEVIDVSDLSKLSVVGSIENKNHQLTTLSVAVSGNYAFLSYGIGFAVIDVSNPLRPELVDLMDSDPWRYPWELTVSSGCAYVADWFISEGTLMIIDVSGYTKPPSNM